MEGWEHDEKQDDEDEIQRLLDQVEDLRGDKIELEKEVKSLELKSIEASELIKEFEFSCAQFMKYAENEEHQSLATGLQLVQNLIKRIQQFKDDNRYNFQI